MAETWEGGIRFTTEAVVRHDLTGNIWKFVLPLGIGVLAETLAVTGILYGDWF